jgi:hypothetical protein
MALDAPKTKKPAIAGFFVFLCYFLILLETIIWSPRQESNLYLALRRHSFYPLNHGERKGSILSLYGPKMPRPIDAKSQKKPADITGSF